MKISVGNSALVDKPDDPVVFDEAMKVALGNVARHIESGIIPVTLMRRK